MKTLFKNKNAKLYQTKTWGYHVVDYKKIHDTRPIEVLTTKNYNEAKNLFDNLTNCKCCTIQERKSI